MNVNLYMIGFVIVCHRINEYLTFRSISVSRYEASREGWTAPIALIFVSNLGNGYRISDFEGICITPGHVGAVLSQVELNRTKFRTQINRTSNSFRVSSFY